MEKMPGEKLEQVADFLYEIGIMAKTPRSGFYFLGSGKQSVAEHTNRVAYIGYALALLHGSVDTGKVLKMCLLHDLPETRVSDLNYVHQQYVTPHEDKVIEDLTKQLPFGEDIKNTLGEYKERSSEEAKLAKDADVLEFILSLKEQVDTGNTRAETWLPSALKRLKTDIAKQVAEVAVKTQSDHWWFFDKDSEWWISRNKETHS